jgi:hypothetical protein
MRSLGVDRGQRLSRRFANFREVINQSCKVARDFGRQTGELAEERRDLVTIRVLVRLARVTRPPFIVRLPLHGLTSLSQRRVTT